METSNENNRICLAELHLGILKGYIPTTHRAISTKLHSYFGSARPTLQVRAPHIPALLNSDSPPHADNASHLSQKGKITPSDISLDLLHTEISESLMEEPDLLILFSPTVELAGYPPWQVRLTEIL